ncbi:hypothetical protein CANCADRAFT_148477 [Tortispora caseinolytica NRRL Y-17796]|uniref:Mitochondrial carrier protein n=1 Tax=Tortispora caseinolytica NRRL Y-17796 TaxID=767744 RepID=A0A1E4TBV5_9ASCO|nr:hypothetical protein CANCADRAFT_148477 [Tortispora caseinolytica NRRL Y-17796]
MSAQTEHKSYTGFVAGAFSGMSKLLVGHPFDTIKVRMQTAPSGQFTGSLDCFLQTIRKEGPAALYKGTTPPLLGWMVMDSVMLGSYHNYKQCFKKYLYNDTEIPLLAQGVAGMLGGWTVSLVAAPVEHIKARLQVQYNAQTRLYSGPIDCIRKIYNIGGIRAIYHALPATVLFRSHFFFFWITARTTTDYMNANTSFTPGIISFISGGLAAQVFWCTSYPFDVVKQRMMTDNLVTPKYPTWISTAHTIYKESGLKGFTRGFVPCILRAFPANAAALCAYEGILRIL